MQNAPNKLRLIWADKIALTLAAVIVSMAASAWILVAIAAGFAGANHVLASFGTGYALEVVALVLAVWASFRAVDFAFRGATYKLFHTEPAADMRALQPGGNILAH